MKRAKSGSKLKGAKHSGPPVMCAMPHEPVRALATNVAPGRARAILDIGSKWVNGTVLRYYFFDSSKKWKGSTRHKKLVRDAFSAWKAVGIGLDFKEVSNPGEAEVRIGFEARAGHWSYVGRGVLSQSKSQRTMNLDSADSWGIDTAIHEIGHTLGLPHEHQNPKAGIVWDEQKVLDEFAGSPNFWDEATTRHNILRKINPDTVQGSKWDKDSIMHYPFNAGLILKPTIYQTQRLNPAAGLSARDKKWIKTFYPPLGAAQYTKLRPFESAHLSLEPAEQANFIIEPEADRQYQIQTFGESDTVMVLFEDTGNNPTYVAGDDDSGVDRNAQLNVRLSAGRRYILRLRLYYAHTHGDFGVMMW